MKIELFRTLSDIKRIGSYLKPENFQEQDFREIAIAVKKLRSMGHVEVSDNAFRKDMTRAGGHFDIIGPVTLTFDGEQALEESFLSSAVHGLIEIISEQGFVNCKIDYDRALATVSTDPAQALSSASSLLESICKSIHDKAEVKYPSDQSMQPLIKSTQNILKLNQKDTENEDIKRLIGGLVNAAAAVGTLRTKASSAHGKGANQSLASSSLARLGVNSATAVGLYFIERYLLLEVKKT